MFFSICNVKYHMFLCFYPISRFMAMCQGYAPTYLYTTGGGGVVYPICPYAEKCKIGLT